MYIQHFQFSYLVSRPVRLKVSLDREPVRKLLLTVHTLVRPVPVVGFQVHVQVHLLAKLLVANLTLERLLAAVDPIVAV